MRPQILALVIAGLGVFAAPAAAQPTGGAATATATAPSPQFNTETTTVGEMLDNPAARAVLAAHLPDIIADPQFEMARPMTLKSLQMYAPDNLTDAKLAQIDADLARLPVQ